MNDILIFSMIVVFALIPFGFGVVYFLYRGTIIYLTAMTTFIGAMGTGIVAFCVGNLGFHTLYWAIPLCLVWLVGMNFFAKKYIRKPIQELNLKIESLSQGNLNQRIDQNTLTLNNEVGHIAQSVKILLDRLTEVSAEIDSVSHSISGMSSALHKHAVKITISNTSQASSIEEISASMEVMAGNIENNAINSKQTEKIANESNSGIHESNQSVQEAVKAMQKISEKIGTIGDIAFQTNILALNAAVESARAGEFGKGFGVVAGEVRKLAENSKKVTDEIINLAKEGVAITGYAGQKLETILPSIASTSKLIQEISAASNEQNSGAQQINNSIQQLNAVVKNNVKMSDELNNASEEMQQKANDLIDAISFFKK